MFDGDEDDEIQEYMINREDYDGELEEKFNAPFESYVVYAGSAKRSADIRLNPKPPIGNSIIEPVRYSIEKRIIQETSRLGSFVYSRQQTIPR